MDRLLRLRARCDTNTSAADSLIGLVASTRSSAWDLVLPRANRGKANRIPQQEPFGRALVRPADDFVSILWRDGDVQCSGMLVGTHVSVPMIAALRSAILCKILTYCSRTSNRIGPANSAVVEWKTPPDLRAVRGDWRFPSHCRMILRRSNRLL